MQLFFITSLQADKLIPPFSEPAALMLRELLITLTMHVNEQEETVSTPIADSPESTSTCNGLQGLKLDSELQEQFGLGFRSTFSVSSDILSTSSDLDHSLRKGKVRLMQFSICDEIITGNIYIYIYIYI